MKKLLFITLLFLSFTLFSQDDSPEKRTSYSISAGTEYLDDFYVNFGMSVIKPLQDNKELDIKAALNMKTKTNADGETEPEFNIPLKLGINFLFPVNEDFTFLTGTGLSPTIRLAGDDKGFLLGPNIKMGMRLKIHPSMSVFLEACQSCLIGAPKWINPSTEIVAGVNFFL